MLLLEAGREEENLVFIGKKKLEKGQQVSLDPRLELAKTLASRETLPDRVCTEWGLLITPALIPWASSPSHPTSSSCSSFATSQWDHLDLRKSPEPAGLFLMDSSQNPWMFVCQIPLTQQWSCLRVLWGFFCGGDIIPPLFPVVFERKTKSINAVPGSASEMHLLLLSISCGAEGGSR